MQEKEEKEVIADLKEMSTNNSSETNKTGSDTKNTGFGIISPTLIINKLLSIKKL